jgi:PAS domain S-box-containing protein
MALLAAWLAGHFMVVRQVRRLVETTRSLAAGNLEARTGMGRSGGELSQLAQAFDEMAESLEWRLAQLRESESERSLSLDRFRHLVERAPDAILGIDGDLKVFFCNQGAERMFGRGREELEGMELADLLDRAGDWKGTVDALRNPRLERVRAAWARGDGTSFGAEASVARAERRDGCIYTLIVRERKS